MRRSLFFLLLLRLTVVDAVVAISLPSSGEAEEAFGLANGQGHKDRRLAMQDGSRSPRNLALGSEYDGAAAFVLLSRHHGGQSQANYESLKDDMGQLVGNAMGQMNQVFQKTEDLGQPLQKKVQSYAYRDSDPHEDARERYPATAANARGEPSWPHTQQMLESSFMQRTSEDQTGRLDEQVQTDGHWPQERLERQHQNKDSFSQTSMATSVGSADHTGSSTTDSTLIVGVVVVIILVAGAAYIFSMNSAAAPAEKSAGSSPSPPPSSSSPAKPKVEEKKQEYVEDLLASPSPSLWPEKLVVEDPNKKLSGAYWLVIDREPNGMPLWQLSENRAAWIFCGTNGQWFIGDEDEERTNFSVNTGFVASIQEHGGRMPDEIGPGGWLYFDGETWKEEEKFNIVSDMFSSDEFKVKSGHLRDVELLDLIADNADLGCTFVGKPPNRVTVSKVKLRGWASLMQVKVGDEVLAVNGEKIANMTPDAFKNAIASESRPLKLQLRAPSLVAFKFKVENVSYEAVTSNAALKKGFEAKVKQGVATESGAGIEPRHVELELMKGSIVVKVEVSPPPEIMAGTVLQTLNNNKSLGQTVIQGLNQMPDIKNAKSGDIKIVDITAPDVMCKSEDLLHDGAASRIAAMARGKKDRNIVKAKKEALTAEKAKKEREEAAKKIQAVRRGSNARAEIAHTSSAGAKVVQKSSSKGGNNKGGFLSSIMGGKKKPMKCKKGHPLKPMTNPARGTCDGCRKKCEPGMVVMDCRQCNYYLCDTCSA